MLKTSTSVLTTGATSPTAPTTAWAWIPIGGSAVLAAAAVGGLGTLQTVIGIGGVAAAGGYGGLVAMGVCPPPFCRVGTMQNNPILFLMNRPLIGWEQMSATNNF